MRNAVGGKEGAMEGAKQGEMKVEWAMEGWKYNSDSKN